MGDFVIKPAVSAGSADSGRYAAGSPRSRGLAIQHARRLLDADRTVMVQRYVTSVDVVGETGLVFLAGRFAWAVHRDAMLEGPDTGPSTALRRGHIQAVDATPAQVAVGEQALAAAATLIGVPSSRPFLAARVDVVAADDGPQVLELELTHPSLYAGLVPDGHERVAAAIAVRLQT
jgi:hypothetical protein